jgi:hypothetical protein
MQVYIFLLIILASSVIAVDSFCCKVKDSWQSWNKNLLTYRIINYPRQYSKEYTDYVFMTAFKLWSQNGGIKFRHVNDSKVDIIIKFDRRNEHGIFRSGDEISFSIPPGPHELSGDITFNDDVLWTTDGGIFDLFKRIVYEIGLSIGLKSTERETSIMNPHKKCFARQLDDEDREVNYFIFYLERIYQLLKIFRSFKNGTVPHESNNSGNEFSNP